MVTHKIKCNCEICGKALELFNYKFNRAKKHFCSAKCHHQDQKNNTIKIPYKCDCCCKDIELYQYELNTGTKHFCNKDCFHKQQKIDCQAKKVPNCNCDYCGKAIYMIPVKLKRIKHHFCNNDCYVKWLPENTKANKNPSWQGGRVKTDEGYIRIYMPEHPNSSKQYVLEHRLVMEQKLGRYLTKDELVHHLNGNKSDNHEENLVVTSKIKHEKKTVEKVQANRIKELEDMIQGLQYNLNHIYGCPN